MATQDIIHAASPQRHRSLYDPKFRSIVFQVLLILSLVLGIWWIVDNTIENLRRSNISTGFDFLSGRAGFDIGQSTDRLYFRFDLCPRPRGRHSQHAAGRGRLASSPRRSSASLSASAGCRSNWLIRKVCTVYVEVFRNIPPLLVIFFWYSGRAGAAAACPRQPRPAVQLVPQQSRLLFPALVWGDGAWLILAGLVVGIALSIFVARRARARQMATGQQFPVLLDQPGADHRLAAAGVGRSPASRRRSTSRERERST